MSNIYDMNRPTLALTGMEMIYGVQGENDVGIPLFAARELPQGDVLVMRRRYVADRGSTSDADPGTGNLRWNNVTPDDADTLFISNEDTEANNDMGAYLQDSIGPGGRIYIQGCADVAARENWQIWEVPDVGDDGTGYTQLPVILVNSGGVIADNDPIEVSVVSPTPDAGYAVDRRSVQYIYSSANIFALDYASLTSDFISTSLNEDIDSWDITGFDTGKGARLSMRITGTFPTKSITWPAEFNWHGETPPSAPADGETLRLELVSMGDGVFDVLQAFLRD